MSDSPAVPLTGLSAALDRHRVPLALLVLGTLEILPIVGLVLAATVGSGVGIVTAILFVVVGAVPAVGVRRGARWAPVLGLYFAWTGLTVLAITGFSRGFTSLHVAVGALHAGVIVLLTLVSPRAERDPAKKEEGTTHALKENVEAVVVAFIMALVIRCFCIEVFKIPTSSMEPTLMGDGQGTQGDRIMATKYYYALNDVERFDIVVFKYPLNQMKNFIKRVVGLPNEDFFVERGNLWARPTGSNEPFRIQRKPLRIQRAMWIRRDQRSGKPLETGLEADGPFFARVWMTDGSAQGYTVEDGTLRTLQHGSSKDVRFTRREYVEDGAHMSMGELGLEFDVELQAAKGTFYVEIPNEFGRFRLELKTGETGRLLHDCKTRSNWSPLPRLEPERRVHVEFLVVDGLAQVFLDGREAATIEYLGKHDPGLPGELGGLLQIGAAGTTFTLSNLKIGYDVYYQGGSGQPLEGRSNAFPIPNDEFLMMGDNVGSSHDGRMWREHVYKLTDDAARRMGIVTTPGGGPVVRWDGQEPPNYAETAEAKRKWVARHGGKEPLYYIPADDIGYERGIYEDDLRDPVISQEPFPTVHRKFLVGKALWVWFPPSRWFRLIR